MLNSGFEWIKPVDKAIEIIRFGYRLLVRLRRLNVRAPLTS